MLKVCACRESVIVDSVGVGAALNGGLEKEAPWQHMVFGKGQPIL
jgi:hypothetical protein